MEKESLTAENWSPATTFTAGFLTPPAAFTGPEGSSAALCAKKVAASLVLPLPMFPWRGTRDAARWLLQSSRAARAQFAAAPKSSQAEALLSALIQPLTGTQGREKHIKKSSSAGELR
ncbi:hypothetical protein NDU88_004928 [Pleurodeles waltl]|uniref:Uncharacterized protein n=1 Tax=Pleurodeles waltl TaxID=8319 RepID=A0AAV7W6D3_PLEWA|nr:hypothetical protein NDU88_004928 [Pleurodeles waltl]